MTRLGWILLFIFVSAAVAFGFMLNINGTASEPGAAREAEQPAERSTALVIPVAGVDPEELSDSWGDARGGGSRPHNAIDIMAPSGTPVVAAAPGRVEKLFNSRDGGLTVYIRSDDGRTIHYYAHLASYHPALAEGQRVRTGDAIGTVGATGNAGPDSPHLHFEVKRMAEGESWHQGQPINPYPLLAGKASSR